MPLTAIYAFLMLHTMDYTVNATTGQIKHSLRRLLTANEAAMRLGITPKTLWEWMNRGIIPQVKLPGVKPNYDIVDIERIIEQDKSFTEAYQVSNDIFQIQVEVVLLKSTGGVNNGNYPERRQKQ